MVQRRRVTTTYIWMINRLKSRHASGVILPPSPCKALLSLLACLLPSLPPTVRDVDVPPLFRQSLITTGYRAAGLPWRCYVLSLFQIHNQTLAVWSPLLAAVALLLRFTVFLFLGGGGILGVRLQGPEGQGFSLDAASLPLVLYVLSALTFLSSSAAAHLLHPHSEEAHYSFYFLKYVGVAVYQYGSSLALDLYSTDAAWTQSALGQIFLPVSALLSWLSCTACSYLKLYFWSYPLVRNLVQLVLMALGFLLYIYPLIHRIATDRWTSSPAVLLYLLQTVLFLPSALLFSCSVCVHFSLGFFHLLSRGRKLLHLTLALSSLVQQEALFQDFLMRRSGLVRQFGEEYLLLASTSFSAFTLCCVLTALTMRGQARAEDGAERKGGGGGEVAGEFFV